MEKINSYAWNIRCIETANIKKAGLFGSALEKMSNLLSDVRYLFSFRRGYSYRK